MTKSPYDGLNEADWPKATLRLLRSHPLSGDEIVEVVLGCWRAIFESKIGPKGFQIGKDITPKPQIMGFFLHELIPLEFAIRYPEKWSPERTAHDKDLVYLSDSRFSIEIKTSSHPKQIFGNRSFAQVSETKKKDKAGYYLAINFQSFQSANPAIARIRFGWLDASDWQGQRSQTGQQARLKPATEKAKLVTLYPR